MTIKTLPFISVQADWDQVVSEVASSTIPESSFWIACYVTGKPSVQGSVQVKRTEHQVVLEGQEGFEITSLNSRSFKVNCEALNVKDVTVYCPKTTLDPAQQQAVSCMDVSPNGNLFAAAHGTQVSLGQISSGQVQLQLTGHVADVTTVQFFSSNLVVLTGAADFQLKIWSVLNGSNPVTLRGHTSAITSTAIVAQGRNVLSSSSDGTIKLWNCGTSSIIANIHLDTPVNKILLVPLPSKYSPAAFETLDPLEVETADKLVLAAMEDGSVRGIHLGTKKEIFATSKSDNALTAVAYHNGVLVTGDKHGLVQLYVMDHGLEQPWLQWKRNGHTITCLVMKLDENGEQVMCVSAGDGSVYQTNALESMLKEKHVQVTTEFAGSELETVYDMKVLPSDPSSGFQRLMCAVRDGKIKMY